MTISMHSQQTLSTFNDAPRLTITSIIIVYLAALATRMINLLFVGDLEAYAMVEDSLGYWQLAEDWIASGRFSQSTPEGYTDITERVPGYFLFLMPFKFLFGNDHLPIVIVQSALDAATCVMIAMLGAYLNAATGIVAGLVAAASPNMIIHSGLILTDSLFLFTFTLVLLNATRFLVTGKLSAIFYTGLICGVAIMTRPIVQFLPLAMAAAAPFVIRHHGGSWRRGIAGALLILITAAAPSAPLIARNMNSYDSFALTSQSGAHLLFWVTSRAVSTQDGRPFDAVSASLRAKYNAYVQERDIDLENLGPFEASRLQTAFAFQELGRLPATILVRAWLQGAALNLAAPAVTLDPRLRSLNRASYYNAPGASLWDRVRSFLFENNSTYVAWILAGLLGVVVCWAFILYGGWRLWLHSKWALGFAALTTLYFLLIMGPIGSPKYRLPFEPILIVLQSIAFVSLFRIWPSLRKRLTP